MSLRDALTRIVTHKIHPFIAPVPDAGTVSILSIQENIPYWFSVTPLLEPGWYTMTPDSKGRYVMGVDDAYPYQIGTYLSELPRFYVIACFPTAGGAWLCVPFNASDAAQRGWPSGQPRLVHLVGETIQPFDVLVARRLGAVLLYEQVDTRIEHSQSRFLLERLMDTNRIILVINRDFRNAFDLAWERKDKEVQAARAERMRQGILDAQTTVADRMRFLLGFAGAELVNWNENQAGYRVIWQYSDRQYSMEVRRDMRIASAGLCLSNLDSQQNLTSIVGVMEEAKRLGRPVWQELEEDDE
jgi:hypothetical protein